MAKKLNIGWFSFSCCEDSTIVFVELLNEHFFSWKELVKFKHARVLQSKNTLEGIDVAFVEGAIANSHDEEKLREIRRHAKRLVAIGSCAVKGSPSGQRNDFNEEKKEQIRPYIIQYDLARIVKTIKEVVEVDDEVDGCPMQEQKFLEVLTGYLKEFGVVDA